MAVLRTAGITLFGLALFGFGITQLIAQDFPKDLTPFTYLPLRLFWVYLTGLLLTAAGLLLVIRRAVLPAASAIGCLFVLYFLYPHLPRLVANIRDPRVITVAFETLALACGAFLVAAGEPGISLTKLKTSSFLFVAGTVSRYVFAVCLVVFGLQHFMYAEFIESLMPAWLPGKVFFSYAIRFGFLLAAATLVLNLKVRLGMLLLGIMFFTWVVILHAPRAIEQQTVVSEWTSLCIALAMSGVGLYLAGTYGRYGKVVSMSEENVSGDTSNNHSHKLRTGSGDL